MNVESLPLPYPSPRRLLTATLIATLVATVIWTAGCAAPPPSAQLPEPEHPLRPEGDRGRVPADARITDYVLDARLDTEQHQVAGKAQVTWRNTTAHAVDTLPFHLYMNGFRAEDTAWMQSSKGTHRHNEQTAEGPWGYVDVHAVKLDRASGWTMSDGIEGPPGESVELSWQEDPDPSTMTVALPRPVGPGESVTLTLDFTTQLPRVIARTGYQDDFYAVAQWYPKLGVLEADGRWEAHPFTFNDEFYADFGSYTAYLDVPAEMVVGATGVRTAEEVSGERKRLTYQAEMVHDFVWMGDPDFVVYDGEYHGIRIRQLIQPENVADAEIHLAAQIAAFESYEKRYGPYPWSTLTIVHPPEDGRGAGGMEYPTFFTTSDVVDVPAWVRSSIFDERASGVMTTVHEFGHQYFQGLFASREHREPWLDEGVNTFSNDLAMRDRFGEDPWAINLLSQKLFADDLLRLSISFRTDLQPVADPASAFTGTLGNYGTTVYRRTAALLATLRNLAGHEAFDRAFRVYCERARFRHPTGEDLVATLVAELGRVNVAPAGTEPVYLDVPHYFEQALHSTRQVDFAVKRFFYRRLQGEAGWHRDAAGELVGGEPPQYVEEDLEDLDDAAVESVLVLHRVGGFEVPVEVEVELADGTRERRWWDGRGPVKVFAWPGQRVRRATLDPDGDLVLEWRRLDNTAYARDLDEEDGLSAPLGRLVEALSLALLGGIGP